MPRVSAKRQITLPAAGCRKLGIKPGDEVKIFWCSNQFSIIKSEPGAASGILKGLKADKRYSEHDSVMSNFE